VEIKSKEEEDRLVVHTLEKIKQEIQTQGLQNGKKMEICVKLIYAEMLG
jgi:hypothetical protein